MRTRAAGVVAALIASALCVGCGADDPNVSLEIRLVQYLPADDLTKMSMVVWGGQQTYYAQPEVLLTEADVIAATVITRDNGAPAVRLFLSGEGQEKLHRITRDNIGNRLGVIIDGQLQCTWRIDEPINSGVVTVKGHMLEAVAERYSRALTRTAATKTMSDAGTAGA